mmetsp:Transcript_133898/g.232685  ORF Transcript_133898/g.232685 Transcript_133898/m.232685 type:complete len:115 (-) Transcript_133898:15-359(-)
MAVHYQLKAHLRGEESLPFVTTELLNIAEESGKTAREIERSATTYWLQEWLKRRAGVSMKALVLGPIFKDRQDSTEYKLLLVDEAVTVDCDSQQKLKRGDMIDIQPDEFGQIRV